MLKRNLLTMTAATGLMYAGSAAAVTTLLTESFELPEGDPSSAYTLNGDAFDDGFFDFYDRFDDIDPSGTNGARDDFSGIDGVYGIAAQDLDSGDGPGGSPVILTVGLADITGESLLGVTVALGALDSEPGFFNFESSDGDGLTIVAVIDSVPTPIAAFIPSDADSDGDGGDLVLDADLDGTPDGPALTTTLTDYTFGIPGVGSDLAIDFVIASTDSFEPIVIDNVRILSDLPEPASLALLGLGGLAMLRRRG